MGVNISYMGTKRGLAPAVAEIINSSQDGILLDAFSGMCSVGETVGVTRQIWSNDIQVFSSEVAKALFTSSEDPPQVTFAADAIFPNFDKHLFSLSSCLDKSIQAEQKEISSDNYAFFCDRHKELLDALTVEIPIAQNHIGNLFTTKYSSSYFGVKQAIEIDSIYHSISVAASNNSITSDLRRWLLIALGRAMLRASNTTGHFAQYLKPKDTTYKYYMNQRTRSIWDEWLLSICELSPVGSVDWRMKNKCFNEDSMHLVKRLKQMKVSPSVVYADPPYTDDQYSRYYHILETLVLYDYPATTHNGLYRTDRFKTPFSQKSKVISAFNDFVCGVAAADSDLVLSYPTNGLLYKDDISPLSILKKYFKKVEICYSQIHSHSTFGASKGNAKSPVTEVIYLAKNV